MRHNKRKWLAIAATALTLGAGSAQAQVIPTLFLMNGHKSVQQKGVTLEVSVKEGEVLTGNVSVRVKVTAKNPITQVEFYVNGDLRDTDTSTPYEFKIDTLTEKEGELKLRFAAFTSEGEKAETTVTVKVDNLGSKGADFHVEHANDLIRDGKYEEAILACRLALKAKPKYNPALIALARANYGKGQLDEAQRYAEDALEVDKGNAVLADLLAAIRIKQAFLTFAKGGNDLTGNKGGEKRLEAIKTIGTALQKAAAARQKLLEDRMDAIGAVTDANRMKYVDASMEASRYSAAINALMPAFMKDDRDPAIADRLIYAQLRAGRLTDAISSMKKHKLSKNLDALGYALSAIIEFKQGHISQSDDDMKEAKLSDGDNISVRLAEAYLALGRERTNTLSSLVATLQKDESQRSEVNYYLATLNRLLNNYDLSRKYFERTILIEPANYDMYIERANESFAIISKLTDADEKKYELSSAKTFYETALAAKPDSPEALTGLALVSMVSNASPGDSLKLAQTAAKAGPQYAAAQYALSAAYQLASRSQGSYASQMAAQGKNAEANAATRLSGQYTDSMTATMVLAAKLDPAVLAGRISPTPMEAWTYFYRYGRNIVITPPK